MTASPAPPHPYQDTLHLRRFSSLGPDGWSAIRVAKADAANAADAVTDADDLKAAANGAAAHAGGNGSHDAGPNDGAARVEVSALLGTSAPAAPSPPAYKPHVGWA